MAAQKTRIRNRTKSPSVAKEPIIPIMRDLVDFSFAEGLAQQFAHILKIESGELDHTIAALEELGSSYLTWKQTPISSREIIRGDLLKIEQLDSTEELQAMLPRLDKDTETYLWVQLKSGPHWPDDQDAFQWLRVEPDLDIIRRAAAAAAKGMKGGDYANHDLYAAVSALVDFYELCSPEKATVGRPGSTAPLPSFVRLFFEQVDQDLSWHSVWNALDRETRTRKSISSN